VKNHQKKSLILLKNNQLNACVYQEKSVTLCRKRKRKNEPAHALGEGLKKRMSI
jgi:hypothetical protein